MYSHIPLDLNQLLDVGIDQWFQICIVDTRGSVMAKGLLRQLVNSFISLYATMAWYPAETNMCAVVTQQPEEVHDMTNERVLSVFTLNHLQAGHWVRVDYYIVVNLAHMPVIVQCQSDGCSLSSKYVAVVWQSFGQVVAGCLTILEMAVDDCCCPYFSFNLETKVLTSLCDHRVSQYCLNLAWASGLEIMQLFNSFNKVVSVRIVIVCSWWKIGCPQGTDQLSIDLFRGHGCLYLETNGMGRGSRHASSPIWPGDI